MTARDPVKEFLASCLNDPLKHVIGSYPWNTEKSIQLVPLPEKYRARFPECQFGPDEWQCEFLEQWGRDLTANRFDGSTAVDPIRYTTLSGHGVGKSTLSAFITKFILDTRPHSKGTVTANTSPQLRTKTWAELGKWHKMSLTADWFSYINSSNSMRLVHKEHPETWFAAGYTCDPENSEAFAGQHAGAGTSFYIFDEASKIPDIFFEVREGGLIGGEPMTFDFGNGTRNTGRFFENCEGRFAHRYRKFQIDSRQAHRTNKKMIAEDIEEFGEDSDFVRVRWLGKFPSQSSTQLIPSEMVYEAQTRTVPNDPGAPVVIGVDVARFGDDSTIIYPRKGYDARSFAPRRLRKLDTITIATEVVQYITELRDIGYRTHAVFVDGGGGYGGGVVDQLKRMNVPVVEVVPHKAATNNKTYALRIDEMYGTMRDAIKAGLALPDPNSRLGKELFEQLTQREFGYTLKQQVRLESKDSLKSRGLSSPDVADALALTYAQPVSANDEFTTAAYVSMKDDYDPFEL